ncbi:LysM peptidoglycan-binding domain-containing protein [Microbacterium sp. JZ31]|uniref:LysM peptidoglycan-binding domain-containing protein n=1 Tax=Microbacterium sp. JZ31 TaxID=1906274 RepID=UPI001931B418|nr:LysM peptidoglycan-binding domain-containing protein [Microbacterium sp. JZ31]
MRSLLTTVPVAIAGSIALSLGATPAAAADVKTRDGVREGHNRTDAFGSVVGANAVKAAPAPRVETAVRTAAAPTTHVVQPGDTVTRIAIRAGLRTIDVLTWNNLSWSSTIYPGQVLRLTKSGTAAAKPAAAKPVAKPAAAAATYTVKAGDTVWGIAHHHKTTVDAILRANGLSSAAVIYPGQKLKVSGSATSAPAATPARPAPVATPKPAAAPASSGATYTVRAGDTVWGIAQKHGVSIATIIRANGLDSVATIFPGQKLKVGAAAAAPAPALVSSPAPAAAPVKAVSGKTHEVKAGDTLWAIAHKHGTTVSAILKANGLSSGAIIYPGQKLKLSGATAAPAAVSKPSAGYSEDPRVQRSAVLDAQQVENARIIIRVGRDIGASDKAIAIALATAMVESGIRNLNYGDRDSLGLFQQRPSAGWGTPEQIRDRVRATRVFFGGAQNPNKGKTRGLYDIKGWEKMEFTKAAQAVQISAFPNRYGQWETAAYGWLRQLG